MTTRRRFLAGIGTAAATGLAGCSSLGGPDERESEEIDSSAFGDGVPGIVWPASPFPVSLPASLLETHRTRASQLYSSVPASPPIPNEVVANEVAEDREYLGTRMEEGSDATITLEAIDDWRSIRGSAAHLRGTYRAATGSDDAADVADRRETVRAELGEFVADLEYRATDPIEAVLVYAPVEALLGDVRQYVRPIHPYPDTPLTAVEKAGDAVRDGEVATASLTDARGFRETYLADRDSVDRQWSRLIDVSRTLDHAVHRTRETVGEYVQQYDPGSVFDRNLGPVPEELFRVASRRVESGSGRDREYERYGHGSYARAILDSTQELAAIAALDRVVDGIESAGFAAEATVTAVNNAAADARSAVESLGEATNPHLAIAVARPGIGSYAGARRRLDERYFDPADAQASFRYAAMYARVAPQAADYLVDRLRTDDP
jgi:hypothetical protein